MEIIPAAEFMDLAIKEARRNLMNPAGGPFGAAVVRDGRVLAVARNTVFRNDPTAHAEINAIRKACRELGTFDLEGAILYSTTEPCPMCFGAAHWARVGTIVFGTRVSDARDAGFHELEISNRRMKSLGGSGMVILGGFMRKECLALFREWPGVEGGRPY